MENTVAKMAKMSSSRVQFDNQVAQTLAASATAALCASKAARAGADSRPGMDMVND